jgi:hypothetical protein
MADEKKESKWVPHYIVGDGEEAIEVQIDGRQAFNKSGKAVFQLDGKGHWQTPDGHPFKGTVRQYNG